MKIMKWVAVLAFAAGYVAGAKAGRVRYEQIRRGVQRVASNPTVQEMAHEAQHRLHEQAPAVKQKVAHAADRVRHHGDHAAGAAPWPADTGTMHAGTPGPRMGG